MSEVEDGEMVRCTYCSAKFTVTKLRRYRIIPRELERGNLERLEYSQMESFISEVDNETLLFMVKTATSELVDRYRKGERILSGKSTG
jgi:hypothetical protein